jgi:hypothetical protein
MLAFVEYPVVGRDEIKPSLDRMIDPVYAARFCLFGIMIGYILFGVDAL